MNMKLDNEILTRYVLDEVTLEEREAIEAALAEDSAAQLELEEIQAAVSILNEAFTDIEAPCLTAAQREEVVQAAVESEHTSGQLGRPASTGIKWFFPLTAAAASILFFVGALLVNPPDGRMQVAVNEEPSEFAKERNDTTRTATIDDVQRRSNQTMESSILFDGGLDNLSAGQNAPLSADKANDSDYRFDPDLNGRTDSGNVNGARATAAPILGDAPIAPMAMSNKPENTDFTELGEDVRSNRTFESRQPEDVEQIEQSLLMDFNSEPEPDSGANKPKVGEIMEFEETNGDIDTSALGFKVDDNIFVEDEFMPMRLGVEQMNLASATMLEGEEVARDIDRETDVESPRTSDSGEAGNIDMPVELEPRAIFSASGDVSEGLAPVSPMVDRVGDGRNIEELSVPEGSESFQLARVMDDDYKKEVEEKDIVAEGEDFMPAEAISTEQEAPEEALAETAPEPGIISRPAPAAPEIAPQEEAAIRERLSAIGYGGRGGARGMTPAGAGGFGGGMAGGTPAGGGGGMAAGGMGGRIGGMGGGGFGGFGGGGMAAGGFSGGSMAAGSQPAAGGTNIYTYTIRSRMSGPASSEGNSAGITDFDGDVTFDIRYQIADRDLNESWYFETMPVEPVYWAGHNTEEYDSIEDNPFKRVTDEPLSTFSIDVDTASYANIRRFLNQGQLPPPGAVRIEEMVNYFDYNYPVPDEGTPFSASMFVAGCPWNSDHRLARIGIQGWEMSEAERPASNLVFLLDVSGSMNPANKLPLLKQGMKMLVQQMDDRDKIAIVVYAGAAGMVLPPTPGSDQRTIMDAIDRLESGGSTNGEAGISLAYSTAVENFIEGGVNRVILATDGDFNVGVTDRDQLTSLIEENARTGVFLTILGFGMGNVKDATLEELSNKGNGNYAYIDTLNEARKVLVEEMGGTLVTIAKDVKIQVEFNPFQVAGYRLIGYENRVMAAEDFNDDTKDAGEIGAGHTVTALYELVPVGQEVDSASVDPLRYQSESTPTSMARSGELLTLKLRYKEPDSDTSSLLEFPIRDNGMSFIAAPQDFKFAASVAAFGMLLRNSEYRGTSTLDSVLEMAHEGQGADPHGYRAEFIELVEKAIPFAQE